MRSRWRGVSPNPISGAFIRRGCRGCVEGLRTGGTAEAGPGRSWRRSALGRSEGDKTGGNTHLLFVATAQVRGSEGAHPRGARGSLRKEKTGGRPVGRMGRRWARGRKRLGRSRASGSQAGAENTRGRAVGQERWRVASRVERPDQVPQTGDCNSRD